MPLREDFKLISVDDHVIEPPGVWQDRLPAALRDAGPKIVDLPGHIQAWEYEGEHHDLHLLGSPATRIFRTDGTGEDLYARHYDDMVPGAYEVKERVRAMDEDGVWAQLLFPTFPRFAGTRFIKSKDMALASACVVAYNDWMIDEWCAYAPERFIPTIIIQLWDPQAAAAEIRRCAGRGARAVTVVESPASKALGLPSYWTNYWDPVFAAAEETGLVLCMHVGTSGSLTTPSPESEAASDAVPISLCGLNSMAACADIIFSGILQRHPNVKVSLAEGGSGWVPYLVERMDYTWRRTRNGVDRSISPGELFQRHFWTCFISDRTAIEIRNAIGLEKLMWESDYPHNDSEWPNSRKFLAESVHDIPDEDVHRIVELNARDLFNFH